VDGFRGAIGGPPIALIGILTSAGWRGALPMTGRGAGISESRDLSLQPANTPCCLSPIPGALSDRRRIPPGLMVPSSPTLGRLWISTAVDMRWNHDDARCYCELEYVGCVPDSTKQHQFLDLVSVTPRTSVVWPSATMEVEHGIEHPLLKQ